MTSRLFDDFESLPIGKVTPLRRLLLVREDILNRRFEAYAGLLEEAIKDLVSLSEESALVKAYHSAEAAFGGLDYDADDIAEFCAALESCSLPVLNPVSSLFLSVLVNGIPEDHLELPLSEERRIFQFLGYRLPEGKTLILRGETGDFTGACLMGGRLIVEGSAGNWCGAGMVSGEILVRESAGQHTGAWMQGGRICIEGPIGSVGKNLLGGSIYQGEKLLSPQEARGTLR